MSELNVNLLCPHDSIRILDISEMRTFNGQLAYDKKYKDIDWALVQKMIAGNEIALCKKVNYEGFRPIIEDDSLKIREKENGKCRYDIYINAKQLQKIAKSRKKAVKIRGYSWWILKVAIIVHELSHIRYDSFSEGIVFKNDLEADIFNILEDARIEYRLSMDFPMFANYLSILLCTLQPDKNWGQMLLRI